MSALVKLEVKNRIARVTIDNPPMNALGDQAKGDLGDVLDLLEEKKIGYLGGDPDRARQSFCGRLRH